MTKVFDSDYVGHINSLLKPATIRSSVALDLFAGCGGLALGFEASGFETIGYEMNTDGCNTYNANLTGACHEKYLTTEFEFPHADIVIGGPPCQPFSVGGLQKGLNDSRDGFPVFISAVEQLAPKAWMFENVRGLLYRNRWYFDQVIQKLESFGYLIEYQLLNARDYLVPQNRERVIVVGHKGDFILPAKSNYIVTSGQALGDMAFNAPEDGKYLTASQDAYVAKYEVASKCITPRDLHLDKPARTLTCRNLAGATGDMHRLKLNDGRRRRLLPQEAARLQSFPDWFKFYGTDQSQFNQIGNAVAPMFAYSLGQSVASYLRTDRKLTAMEIKKKRLPQQISLLA